MDEDFGFDSGFDDVGSADLDIDSGFDDSSFDTDFSMDDIGSEDIISNDFSETDFSIDAAEDFDSFDDVESTELDIPSVEDDFLIETDAGLELPDDTFETDETTDIDVNDSSLGLDDFDADIDMLETEDSSSLSELDTDDFDDTFETDNVTNDTVEEDLFNGTDGNGYFENIPNEMEPFVMEEAQAETDTDATVTFPEFEEDPSDESESGLESDTFEETESLDDTISNEPPPTEADNDIPDEEMAIEGTDVSEGDKSPYEAMRDYMYEHNYGQMDYPEYSQDPEWQALNEQYTASLEETPEADELLEQAGPEMVDTDITDDTAIETEESFATEISDINEPQELHDGDAIDIHGENNEVISETTDAFEESDDIGSESPDITEGAEDEANLDTADTDSSESDKPPYEAMRDYMYEHNYGQMNYPEYSQDPEWQALNEQYTASLEETTEADELTGENLEQAELETPDTVISEGMVVDTSEVIPETAPENTDDMPELTEMEDMLDVASDEDLTEAVATTEIEELHELTDAECDEIYEPWNGERLSESFDDIDIAADPERLDSTLNDFVESNWETLSLDEQKQSMQSLADCVVDTIGFKNPPAIEFYNNSSEGDYGGYDSSTNTLSVNEYMLYDSNEAADTIAHELWHAHQHECAMDPQSTRDLQYQFNFDNYIPPEYGMEDYQSQLIEAEARAFAEQFKDRLAQLRGRI